MSDYKPVYDIIFLDIDMPTMNGIELAKYIRKMDGEVSIVFVTNMAKYAINGYEVDADDFIVKPVRYGNFKLKLDRVIKKHGSKKNVPTSPCTKTESQVCAGHRHKVCRGGAAQRHLSYGGRQL